MKYLRVFIILLIIIASWNVYAQEEFVVRVVYFQPTDAPDGNWHQINSIIQDAKRIYQDAMGSYNSKTFDYEKDANGNLKVALVKGNNISEFYATADGYNRVNIEMHNSFNFFNQNTHNSANLVIVSGVDKFTDTLVGAAIPINGRKSGGYAWVCGGVHFNSILVAHEIGHIFGLHHNSDTSYLMYASATGRSLFDYETSWLNKSHYFNNKHDQSNIPVFVGYHGNTSIDKNENLFKFELKSDAGLHQVVVEIFGLVVAKSITVHGNHRVIEVPMHRNYFRNHKTIRLNIMDINGNIAAIVLNPDYAEAYYYRGGALLRLEKRERAKLDLAIARSMKYDSLIALDKILKDCNRAWKTLGNI